GREQLQREGDLIEDDRRQRDHQDQEEQRKGEETHVLPSEEKPDGAGEDANQRNAGEEQLGAEQTRQKHEKAGADEQQPDKRRLARSGPQRLPLLPGEVKRKRNDYEAVRVVLVARPLTDERREHGEVHPDNSRADERRWNNRSLRHLGP